MSQQARDEAGNIWEIDAAGNPVRLVQQAGQAPQGFGEPVFSTPGDPNQRNLNNRRASTEGLPAGYMWNQAGTAAIPIPGYNKEPSATQVGIEAKQEGAQKRAGVVRALMGEVRSLYERNLKGGLPNAIAGHTPAVINPNFEEFAAAANGILPLIRPLVAQTAKEGDSDKEMEVFMAYIPKPTDSDQTIERKLSMLDTLIGGMAEGKAPSITKQTIEAGGAGAMPGASADGQTGGGNGPDTPDQSTRYYGNGTGPAGGGGLALSQNGTQAVPDPVGQAVAARLNTMLKGGASDEQIASYAQQVGRVDPSSLAQALQFRRQNPDYNGDYSFSGFDQQNVPIGYWRDLWNSAAQSPAGAFAISAGNAASLNTLDNLTSNPELTRAGIDAVSDTNPYYMSTLGTLVGGASAAGGLEAGAARLGATRFAPLIGDALFGAGSGAGGSDDGNRLLGAVGGGTVGALGGVAGRGAFRTAGRAAKGVRNATIDELRTRGIPLTVGQLVSQSGRLGSIVKGLEDAGTSIPIVGDMISGRRLDSMRGAERSAFKEAVEPLGQQYSGDTAERGVRNLKQIVSQGYSDTLDPVRLQQDTAYLADVAPLPQQAADLPTPMDSRAGFLVNKKVPQQFGPDGELTGNRFQQALRALRRERSNNFNQPNGVDFADVANAQEDALTGLVQRQSPETMPALRAANEANKRVSTLRDAVNAARNGSRSGEGGLITMSQLADAAARTAKKYGGTQGTPDQPFFDLTSAARDVIPSRLPDSGTPKRLLTQGAVGLGLAGAGGGADYATGSNGKITGAGLTLGALLAAGGSRQGQRALTRLLADRPDILRRIGMGLEDRATLGGYLGAGASPALLPAR